MTLIRVFGKEFIIASGIKLIVDCLQFVEPLLVEKLIIFVRDQTQEIEVGFIISIMFFINALCKAKILKLTLYKGSMDNLGGRQTCN